MQNNKIILSYSPNFNKVVNTDFLDGDNISKELVKIYKNFIFSIDINNLDDINNVKEIDKIMGKYVDDYYFRKTFQERLTSIRIKKSAGDVIRAIVLSIIELFKSYEDETTRIIYVSKWI